MRAKLLLPLIILAIQLAAAIKPATAATDENLRFYCLSELTSEQCATCCLGYGLAGSMGGQRQCLCEPAHN